MWVSVMGYLFALILGIWGFVAAGEQIASGRVVGSIDNLFYVLTTLLFGVVSFSYLAWRFGPILFAARGAAGGAGAGAAAGGGGAELTLDEPEHYDDPHRAVFIKIWFGLLALTLIEVVFGYVQFPVVIMLTALMIFSVVKAAMIMAYFMHLKFDRPALSWMLVPPLVACILIMVGYFFPDSFRAFDLRI